ncbi:MAG: hypothetical protein GX442_18885 [Candidatus Riflebacteria bacterium]|nr:hypothetical protein [Candidatus Riflebacteria bacterium]
MRCRWRASLALLFCLAALAVVAQEAAPGDPPTATSSPAATVAPAAPTPPPTWNLWDLARDRAGTLLKEKAADAVRSAGDALLSGRKRAAGTWQGMIGPSGDLLVHLGGVLASYTPDLLRWAGSLSLDPYYLDRWEYQVATASLAAPQELQACLNEQAQQGWTLDTLTPGQGTLLVVFRRRPPGAQKAYVLLRQLLPNLYRVP